MKWAPNKVIYHVSMLSDETQESMQDFYFLFCWAADRFMKRNEKKAEELGCHFCMGGESLFLLW